MLQNDDYAFVDNNEALQATFREYVPWTQDQDKQLLERVATRMAKSNPVAGSSSQSEINHWKWIADGIPGKNAQQCQIRFTGTVRPRICATQTIPGQRRLLAATGKGHDGALSPRLDDSRPSDGAKTPGARLR
jgi:hypothetical protein